MIDEVDVRPAFEGVRRRLVIARPLRRSHQASGFDVPLSFSWKSIPAGERREL